MKAAGINPFDVHARSGTSYVRLSLPTILGKEIAGIVEETDELATRFQVRVILNLQFNHLTANFKQKYE